MSDKNEIIRSAAAQVAENYRKSDILMYGDALRLHHTVKITRIPVVTLTENDYPMATIDDLNALLNTLAHEAD